MGSNKVKVRIYGQEYTIAGEKDEESILRVADLVNEKMRELGRSNSISGQGTLAVLAAINIADEYFEALQEIERMKAAKTNLEKDAEHYLKMWDEAKKNFIQHKEHVAKSVEEKKESEERYRELENRCSEFENSFFELQRENLQLKNELSRYRKQNEF
jgi:cell division protein ZapA (FtsZ GTPase activity inhibitor)